MSDDHAIHAPFSVPFEHRVHFTRRVFDPANHILAKCLPPTREVAGANGGTTAECRVAFVLDAGLVNKRPTLPDEVIAYTKAHRSIHLAHPPMVVPGGEAAKNQPAVLQSVLQLVDSAHLCRRSALVAVGGGALLDLAGYAAAIAHRGIRLVRLPTTTLAQDDSGVGVKNGVNAFGKKNFLGAFAVPCAVINDADFLLTLHPRDWRSGFSEAVKVALVKDGAFFEEIERAAPAIAVRDPHAAGPVIRRSAELHLRHITEGGDPFETTVARPLDFGHWSAHKFEQLSGYTLRHGEAVAIGVALDTVYSSLAGDLTGPEADRVLAVLRTLGFELDHPLLDDPRLLDGLEEFREHLGGGLTISLLHAIGDAYDAHAIDPAVVRLAIERLRA
jgi:3-dehydroquinate synthase